MKKVLSLLGLIAILSMLSPVYARGHGEVIHAGPGMHRQMRPHGGWYAPPPPPWPLSSSQSQKEGWKYSNRTDSRRTYHRPGCHRTAYCPGRPHGSACQPWRCQK